MQITDGAALMLEPVLAPLQAALERLPPGPDISIAMDDIVVFYELHGTKLILDAGFAGPMMRHPDERDHPLALDRWRRMAASILEGTVLARLAAQTGQQHRVDWLWVGVAAWYAHTSAPDMALGWVDLARAREHARPGTDPRQGIAAAWAWKQQGIEPWDRLCRALSGEPVEEAEWLGLGEHVLGHELAAQLPLPSAAVAGVDIPTELPSWSWQPLSVPAHPRGGAVDIEGPAAVRQRFAQANKPLNTLSAAIGKAKLTPAIGGPLGDWVTTSAHAFGQILGVHGVQFGFRGSGALDVVLADAYAGPVAAVEDAKAVGTSGIAKGKWSVAGEQTVRLRNLVPQGMTMHDNKGARFVLPAGPGGMPEWLEAMQTDWRWQLDGDRLVLFGTMFGGKVEIRLRRA